MNPNPSELEWCDDDLQEAKKMLYLQEHVDKNWFNSLKPISKTFFLAQKEHLRTSIEYWENAL